MAWTRRLSLGTRVLSPRPVLPSSPVRVAICVRRWPMGNSWWFSSGIVRYRAARYVSQATLGKIAGRRASPEVQYPYCNLPEPFPMSLKKRSRVADFEVRSVILFSTLVLGAGLASAQLGPATPTPSTLSTPSASAAEIPAAIPANRWTVAQVDEAFRKTDQDHDGKITRQEATIWTGLSRQFELVDTNKDGNISSAEFDEALK
ncbi:MAG: EF-hand domain-containing protein [Comamonadaceae bacterium]|nr:MAG: EF-hand domain-containing protein [Comamonadaceae bacterium]